jgi:hypothetical protein
MDSLPRLHDQHLKSTNMLERLNQEFKRRTLMVRIFPDEQSCLRLIRALAAWVHEDWMEDHPYDEDPDAQGSLKTLAGGAASYGSQLCTASFYPAVTMSKLLNLTHTIQ